MRYILIEGHNSSNSLSPIHSRDIDLTKFAEEYQSKGCQNKKFKEYSKVALKSLKELRSIKGQNVEFSKVLKVFKNVYLLEEKLREIGNLKGISPELKQAVEKHRKELMTHLIGYDVLITSAAEKENNKDNNDRLLRVSPENREKIEQENAENSQIKVEEYSEPAIVTELSIDSLDKSSTEVEVKSLLVDIKKNLEDQYNKGKPESVESFKKQCIVSRNLLDKSRDLFPQFPHLEKSPEFSGLSSLIVKLQLEYHCSNNFWIEVTQGTDKEIKKLVKKDEKLIAELSERYDFIEQERDGNCLFSTGFAVTNNRNEQTSEESGLTYRGEIYDYISRDEALKEILKYSMSNDLVNSEGLTGLHESLRDHYKTINDREENKGEVTDADVLFYIEEMKNNPTSYGGQVELIAIARRSGKKVCVHQPASREGDSTTSYPDGRPTEDQEALHFYLHIAANHYDALIPKS